MKANRSETEYTRENYPRTSQEVPFFPYRPVSMALIEMDGIEQIQFDFVQKAGLPAKPLDNKPEEEK